MGDYGDQIYQGRFRRVQAMYPDADRDALAAAFLAGAGAFAEVNDRPLAPSDALYQSVRRTGNFGLRTGD